MTTKLSPDDAMKKVGEYIRLHDTLMVELPEQRQRRREHLQDAANWATIYMALKTKEGPVQ
jgi:hypothetical protein